MTWQYGLQGLTANYPEELSGQAGSEAGLLNPDLTKNAA